MYILQYYLSKMTQKHVVGCSQFKGYHTMLFYVIREEFVFLWNYFKKFSSRYHVNFEVSEMRSFSRRTDVLYFILWLLKLIDTSKFVGFDPFLGPFVTWICPNFVKRDMAHKKIWILKNRTFFKNYMPFVKYFRIFLI